MNMDFTIEEGSALYGLLADSGSDIIVKTDPAGFIVHAAPALETLGIGPPAGTPAGSADRLVAAHLLDLVAPEARDKVRRAHAAAVAGESKGDSIEFPAVTADDREHWYEMRSRALADGKGRVYGALSVLRSIDERRELRERLFAATYTDPLTRLTNRAAFISMLEHMIEEEMEGCLALFSVDFFRTINLKYGQGTGDEVLVVFADLLREMLRAEDIISRIGSEQFAVLLPRTSIVQTDAICSRVVRTLGELRRQIGRNRFSITASAGVAHIGQSVDSTLERAEMALFVAKAKGRNRLEVEKAA